MQMKPSLGMLRPRGAGGDGHGKHRGGPTEGGGCQGAALPADPLPPAWPRQHNHGHWHRGAQAARWQQCPSPVPGVAVGQGKPPAPHPALLSQHPGLAKPGGSLLGSRPGADLLAAPGSGILHVAALAPATPLLRALVMHSVPIPSPGPPRCHRSRRTGCGPQWDLLAPAAARCLRGGWWGGDAVCPPSPGPAAEGGTRPLQGARSGCHHVPRGAAACDPPAGSGDVSRQLAQEANPQRLPGKCQHFPLQRPAQICSRWCKSQPSPGLPRGLPPARPSRLQRPHAGQGTGPRASMGPSARCSPTAPTSPGISKHSRDGETEAQHRGWLSWHSMPVAKRSTHGMQSGSALHVPRVDPFQEQRWGLEVAPLLQGCSCSPQAGWEPQAVAGRIGAGALPTALDCRPSPAATHSPPATCRLWQPLHEVVRGVMHPLALPTSRPPAPALRRQRHTPTPPLAGVPTRSRCRARTLAHTDTLACTRTLSCTSACLHAPVHAHTCTCAGWQSRCAGGYRGMPAATTPVPGPCPGVRMRTDPGCCSRVSPRHAVLFLTPSGPSAHRHFHGHSRAIPGDQAASLSPTSCRPTQRRGAQGRRSRGGTGGGCCPALQALMPAPTAAPLLCGAPAAFLRRQSRSCD